VGSLTVTMLSLIATVWPWLAERSLPEQFSSALNLRPFAFKLTMVPPSVQVIVPGLRIPDKSQDVWIFGSLGAADESIAVPREPHPTELLHGIWYEFECLCIPEASISRHQLPVGSVE